MALNPSIPRKHVRIAHSDCDDCDSLEVTTDADGTLQFKLYDECMYNSNVMYLDRKQAIELQQFLNEVI